MFSYRSLLKQAWSVSWKHKYLWFFGLFASIVASGGTWEYQMMTQGLSQNMIDGSLSSLGNILTVSDLVKNFGLGLVDLFHYDFWVILSALTLLFLTIFILVFSVWLAVSSEAALVADSKKLLNSKKKNLDLTIQAGITEGHRHFWPVLFLNLLNKVLVAFVFFLMSLPLIFMVISNNTILMVVYTIFFVIFTPLSMGLYLMFKYAIGYNVLNDKSFVASVESGWKLFLKNWLVSLEMAVILFIINFLASCVALIFMAIFLLPLLLLGILFNLTWLIILIIMVALIIVITLGSLLTTFQTATWTNLFLRLKDKGVLAKLERLFIRS